MSNRRAPCRFGVSSTLRTGGIVVAVWAAFQVAPAAAQVGHDPAASPFQDVTTRQELTLLGGRFGGNPGEAGVGAQPGTIFGLRLGTRLSGPLDLTVTIAGVNSTRYVIDPDAPVATRTTGPVNYDMVIADLGMNFNLTGRKTFRGLSPYLGIAVGMAFPTDGATDPGGYEASTNFTFVPSFGIRFAVSRSLALQFEARDYLIRYEYPLRYFQPITPVTPVLDPNKYDEKDMTSNWALTLGLSYRFNF